MAKIILKSRYLRAGSRRHSEHLIHYIAKREGVQKIDDTWKHRPATVEQQKREYVQIPAAAKRFRQQLAERICYHGIRSPDLSACENF